MKATWITLILVAGAIAPLAGAQADSPKPPTDGVIVIEPDKPATPDAPSQPQDALKAYEEQMVRVTVGTYAELVEIGQAVGAGQISSEQAEYLTRRSYEIGIIRFQFLDTLHEIIETTLTKEGPTEKTEEQPSQATTLVVAPPSSSSDIPEPVAKYLELTPAQIAAIEARLIEERKQIQPLLQQLSQNRKALTAATHTEQSGNTQIRKLAIEQSHILEQLIIANSRLQRDVYEMLSVEQRKKLATSAPGMLIARDSW